MDPLTIASWSAGLLGVGIGYAMRWRAVRAESRAAGLRAELEAERRFAHEDPLTGLLNRRGFFRRATAVAGDQARHPVTAVVLDLDRFKEVNDTYGHAAGDEILVTVARRLSAYAGGDPVARFGGDEFVALLTGPSGESAGAALPAQPSEAHSGRPVHLADLADLVAAPIDVAGRQLSVSASVGCHPVASVSDLASALYLADTAMYRTKITARGAGGQLPHARSVARSAARRGPADRAELAVESAGREHGAVVA